MDDCFQERLVYSESDNSDVDESNKQTSEKPTAQGHEESLSPMEKSTEALSNQNNLSDESDEDHINKSIKKVKKNARILSSDEEQPNSDIESHFNGKDTQSNVNGTTEHSATVSVRPSICDSDTKSSSDGNKSDKSDGLTQPPTIAKKLKKKKNERRKRLITNQSDSESNDDSTEERSKKQKKSSKKKNVSDQSGSSESSNSGTGSGSGSDSNLSARSNDQSNATENVKPREKTAQRMSAKVAEQQMKEIQSESQRLARQLHVSIPYHKPKQHSLKEFLSRRSIVEQQQKLNSKPMPKAAVAIKMSEDDLIQFMEDMKKRTQEAEEFFQEEEQDEEAANSGAHRSEDSDDEDWVDKSKKDDTMSVDMAKEPAESNVLPSNDCQETEYIAPSLPMELSRSENVAECTNEDNNENGIGNKSSESLEAAEPSPKPATEAPNVIELHTNPTELDDELEAMLTKPTKERPKLSIPTDHVPKLKGDDGFVIDLETNDLKPKPVSGVDELLSRFMKNACVKTPATESQDISIFQTDTGTVERHKFHVNMDEKPKREPKPGESLFKLRSELSQKIKENREKLIAQRLQEEKEQELNRKEMESDEEHLLDEEICEDEESENEMDCADQKKQMESEAMDDQQMEENEQDKNPEDSSDDSENSDQSESEALDGDLDVTEIAKPRKRILTMDDSDDESSPALSNVVPAENGQVETVSQPIESSSVNQSLDGSSKALNSSHDLSVLESEILQLDTEINVEHNKTETSKLFQEGSNDYEEIGESQLMALCSGSFATQFPDNPSGQNGETKEANTQKTKSEETPQITQSKPAFLSSDEEETDKHVSVKVKKKRKKHTLVYSDDEDGHNENDNVPEEQSEEEGPEDEQETVEDEEEDVGERYVEYDSDENEVEVKLKKTDVKKKASEYLENEAELSESEWGSADEDEKDEMNHYEAELGDADTFDKNKLRDELERIRLREQIDDDAREIRILTERFIEEEDNGQERERKFRWKHLNNGDIDDPTQTTDQDAAGVLNNSDDENEAEWRRIRYEREQLLKQQMKGNDSVIEQTSSALEITEQKSVESVTTILGTSKRISIIKPTSNVSSKTSSPFLITKSDLGHLSRKSFLNRDSPILEKLASLSKSGSDGDTILNTAKGKGNYVFVATEKKETAKRKSESENGASGFGTINPSKKSKLDPQIATKLRPQTKAFFESLN